VVIQTNNCVQQLFSPQSFQPIAWSAANNQDVRGPVDYVPFPILISSVGGGWMNNNQFVAPQSGVYYINIATGVSSGGKHVFFTLKIRRIVNMLLSTVINFVLFQSSCHLIILIFSN
jgi:hypothetical protein